MYSDRKITSVNHHGAFKMKARSILDNFLPLVINTDLIQVPSRFQGGGKMLDIP